MTGEKRANMLTEYVGAIERGYFQLPRIPSLYSAHKYCRTGDLYSGSTKDYHLPDEVCSMALAWHAGKRYSGYAEAVTIPRGRYSPGKYEKNFEFPVEPNASIESPMYDVEIKSREMDDGINLLV